MKRNLNSHLLTLGLICGGAMAGLAGSLTDLGPVATRGGWVTYPYPEVALYAIDVSSDGTLAGGTDASGNAFIWTSTYGTVTLGAGNGVKLQGVDWFSGNVLAVGNMGNYPAYWQGTANGTGGPWASLPPANGDTGVNGYWTGTSLGVAADGSDWWVGGFRSVTTSPYETIIRYQNSTVSSTGIALASGGHNRSKFYAASNEGTFAGVEQYGGSAPDGGSKNGIFWKYEPPGGNPSTWLPTPEGLSTSFTGVAQSISGDGSTIGGVDKNGAVWLALWWDRGSHSPTALPRLLISGSTYADWMEVHSLSKDGNIMAGVYYTDPPSDSGPIEAFVYYYNTEAVTRLGDLLVANGIDTTGWTFNDVTAMSDSGNTLAGYGVKDGVVHTWLAQIPPVIRITHIDVASGTIDFTSSGLGDITTSFAVEQSATLVNAATPFVSVAATITGSAPSFQATLVMTGDAQFYRIKHL